MLAHLHPDMPRVYDMLHIEGSLTKWIVDQNIIYWCGHISKTAEKGPMSSQQRRDVGGISYTEVTFKPSNFCGSTLQICPCWEGKSQAKNLIMWIWPIEMAGLHTQNLAEQWYIVLGVPWYVVKKIKRFSFISKSHPSFMFCYKGLFPLISIFFYTELIIFSILFKFWFSCFHGQLYSICFF